MNALIRFLFFSIFMFSPVLSQARSLDCLGVDGGSNTLRVTIDESTPKVNINEETYSIEKTINKGDTIIFLTEKFMNSDGIFIYIGVGGTKDDMEKGLMKMISFDAKTNDPISAVELVCHSS